MQKILLVLAASFLVLVFVLFARQQPQNNKKIVVPTVPPQGMQTLNPELWDFSIKVPPNYQIIENEVFIELINDAGKKIIIVRNSTNFDNLEDYLQDFDTRRKVKSSDETKLIIDGKETIARIDTFPDAGVTEKVYHIYTGFRVYTLSSEDIQLYEDLDQIAQSFRYTP